MPLDLKARKIIFVHGIFGWGENEVRLGENSISYWGDALAQFKGTRFEVHELKCGPVSSYRDRACEIFAQIKGGDFHYENDDQPIGAPAAKLTTVARSKRPNASQPLLPNWSAENPVVLVGHSAGAHTCLALQRLLAAGFFGKEANADWIEAVICISGVLNGSTLTYQFGCDPVTGVLKRNPAWLINAVAHLAELAPRLPLADLVPWLRQWIDVDPWLQQWPDTKPFINGPDNLACDLTLSGCAAANAAFTANPNTYYLSLVTSVPARQSQFGIPIPSRLARFNPLRFADMNLLLQGTAAYQADRADFAANAVPLRDWATRPELEIAAWRDNDGAVSRISQRYPFTGGQHAAGEERFFDRDAIKKGTWYFEHAENVVGMPLDHLDPVFGAKLKLGGKAATAHRDLYQKLAARLSD